MAYLRGEYYTYSDGENIHLPHSMPMKIFDSLVMMRFWQLSMKEKTQAELRAMEIAGGNFGCDALSKKYGRETTMDFVRRMVKDGKNRKKKTRKKK